MRWLCDGTPNCLDHSDERDCCSGHECGGHCLPPEVVCDGWQNCADGSDEAPAACAKRQAPTITASVPHSSNYLILGVLFGFCVLTAGFVFYKCQNRSVFLMFILNSNVKSFPYENNNVIILKILSSIKKFLTFAFIIYFYLSIIFYY